MVPHWLNSFTEPFICGIRERQDIGWTREWGIASVLIKIVVYLAVRGSLPWAALKALYTWIGFSTDSWRKRGRIQNFTAVFWRARPIRKPNRCREADNDGPWISNGWGAAEPCEHMFHVAAPYPNKPTLYKGNLNFRQAPILPRIP